MQQAISFPALRERGRPRKEAYSWGRSGRLKIFANLYKQNKRRRQERNTEQEENREKMMTRCSNGTSILDDDIVVRDILSRLPVKSLMRFKAVCKRWWSLIQHDTQFRDLHLTRSKTRPGIFIVTPVRDYGDDDDDEKSVGHGDFEFFLSSNLFESRAALQTIRKTDCMHYHYHRTLKPVNGLICFIHYSKKNCVRIYNPSTRDITPWIKTTIEMGKCHDKYPMFGFGFDPVTKEHKVICMWTIFRTRTKPMHTVCEILSLGNNSWRRIDEVPPYCVDGDSLYFNGSIYWISEYIKCDNGVSDVIVAFDVGSEKFRSILIPDFIIDQPRESRELADYYGPSISLFEVNGRLALLCRRDSYTVSLWIFDDVDHDYTNKEKIGTTSSSSSSSRRNNWTEVTITLPFCWGGDISPIFHTIAGTDQIILECSKRLSAAETNRKILEYCSLLTVLSVYSYNWERKTFEKIEITGISLPIRYPSLFTPLLESLFLVH